MEENRFLYKKVYDYYRRLILSGKLTQGERLPSIRKCMLLHQVSKTTVDKAYMLLCDDGFVIPKNQSGFYVSNKAVQRIEEEKVYLEKEKKKDNISDYTSTGVDREVFDLTLWTKYIKRALRQESRLMDYGHPRGEEELREGIAEYLKNNRSCVCDKNDIVIGAGVQNLLNILCPLLPKNKKRIYFYDSSYKQGEAVFRDHGYTVVNDRESADILYISPSHLSTSGDIMSVAKRHETVLFAKENSKLIIEDDYDSEFRDISSPTPSLQGIDSERVIYIGTFSKLLLPSIRISYMLLPSALEERYEKISSFYNQTVSIPDQLALREFIDDGKLIAQIKRARKIYTQKSKLLKNSLKENFGNAVRLQKTANPLYVLCTLKSDISPRELLKELSGLDKPVKLIAGDTGEGTLRLSFSVSSVSVARIEEDAKNLYQTVKRLERR